MAGKTQSGYLVIGDITGYTNYVAKTELEHSQEILSELLALILNQFTPMLKLAKLEGDAVFAYAPQEEVIRGESVLETIEATYVAFRDRVSGIRNATTCTCAACSALPDLDLKFFVHYGDFIIQDIAGYKEMVGADVNLVHRITKNKVKSELGWYAYAMITPQALTAMGITSESMQAYGDSYENLGEFETFLLNMHDRHAALTSEIRLRVDEGSADVNEVLQILAPPNVVWAYLNDPVKRMKYINDTDWRYADRPEGRSGSNTTNHCAHGENGLVIENIRDFFPYRFMSCRNHERGMEHTPYDINFILEPVDGGAHTRFTMLVKLGIKGSPPDVVEMMRPMVIENFIQSFTDMRDLIAEEYDVSRFVQLPANALAGQVYATAE